MCGWAWVVGGHGHEHGHGAWPLTQLSVLGLGGPDGNLKDLLDPLEGFGRDRRFAQLVSAPPAPMLSSACLRLAAAVPVDNPYCSCKLTRFRCDWPPGREEGGGERMERREGRREDETGEERRGEE